MILTTCTQIYVHKQDNVLIIEGEHMYTCGMRYIAIQVNSTHARTHAHMLTHTHTTTHTHLHLHVQAHAVHT